MPDVQPLRAGIVHHRALAELHGLVLIADQMVRDAQHPFHVQRGGRIIQLARNALALLAGAERPVKIPDPGQVDVQSAQQPELPVQILEIPRKLKAACERRPDRFGIALREHHGDAERGLQRHLLAAVDRIRIERDKRLLRPAIALRQQCQFEEKLGRRSRQIHADRPVGAIRKAPGQRGPDIGQMVGIGKEAARGLHARGFERDVAQEVAEIFGVSARDTGRFAVLDELGADEGAGGVEQTIAQPPLRR